MFSCAYTKCRKIVNVLEQVRMLCLLAYIIGAILFLLTRYNNRNFDIESNWLIGMSVIVFLVLSYVKFVVCTTAVESKDDVDQKLKLRIVHNVGGTGKLMNKDEVGTILVLRCVSNIIFTYVCILTGCLLFLRNFLFVQEEVLILNIYDVVLASGMSLAGLYFFARFLGASLGVCNNFIDNLNAKHMKCEATDFVINEINSQMSAPLSRAM